MYSHPSGRERARKTLVLRVLGSSPRSIFCVYFLTFYPIICQNNNPGPELLDILIQQNRHLTYPLTELLAFQKH